MHFWLSDYGFWTPARLPRRRARNRRREHAGDRPGLRLEPSVEHRVHLRHGRLPWPPITNGLPRAVSGSGAEAAARARRRPPGAISWLPRLDLLAGALRPEYQLCLHAGRLQAALRLSQRLGPGELIGGPTPPRRAVEVSSTETAARRGRHFGESGFTGARVGAPYRCCSRQHR